MPTMDGLQEVVEVLRRALRSARAVARRDVGEDAGSGEEVRECQVFLLWCSSCVGGGWERVWCGAGGGQGGMQ